MLSERLFWCDLNFYPPNPSMLCIAVKHNSVHIYLEVSSIYSRHTPYLGVRATELSGAYL